MTTNHLCEKEYLSFKTNFPKMKKCKNHAICEHEGKHYCGVHDPKRQELKKERYEKRQGLKMIFYYSKILKKRDSHAKK